MEVVYARCAGLDVHKKKILACVRVADHGRSAGREAGKDLRDNDRRSDSPVRLATFTFGHTRSHGKYRHLLGKPIYAVLEGSFTLLVVNAAYMKAVPGRKTDVRDCEWIADLLAHGLLKGGFVPPAEIRDLRDLTRYRTSLIGERTREVNRLHKLLETANIKLTSVATDVMGVSTQAMLRSLLEGATDPDVLADLAKGVCSGRNFQS